MESNRMQKKHTYSVFMDMHAFINVYPYALTCCNLLHYAVLLYLIVHDGSLGCLKRGVPLVLEEALSTDTTIIGT